MAIVDECVGLDVGQTGESRPVSPPPQRAGNGRLFPAPHAVFQAGGSRTGSTRAIVAKLHLATWPLCHRPLSDGHPLSGPLRKNALLSL